MNAFKLNPKEVKKTSTIKEGRSKDSKIMLMLDMARDKDTVKERDKQDRNEYQVYMDGSDQNRGVGASAILYKNEERIHALQY